jgi:phosphatidylserine/phosphatidylglycerophosphate/cardiolipin synthase-like enzyme
MATTIASWVDARIGDGVERIVQAKHRARLRRLGWERALAPAGPGVLSPDDRVYAAGHPPPRPGCSVEVLIDGEHALAEMARTMQSAQQSIRISGWHVDPAFALVPGDASLAVGPLLAELAERVDVRVLVWAGAPVPVFHPTRGQVRDTIDNLVRGTRIRCEPDPREHPFHCHHEKTIVIDGRIAFVGGIDLTDLAGDRYDSQAHRPRRRLGWHDVAARLEGPAVADVDDHFLLRWKELTGEQLEQAAESPPSGACTVQVVRTVAERMYDRLPNGEFRILESYTRALRSAQRFIYIENQFLWAPEIVAILTAKLRDPPHPDFRIVVVLPAHPNNGRDDTRGQLGVLTEADTGSRFLAATIRAVGDGRDDPIYVHAKVAIVDDRWLTLGSANLNAHSLLNDTEVNIASEDRGLAADTRIRLWAEHLELDTTTVARIDARELIDKHWRPIALEQLERQTRGEPPTHRLIAMPGVSKRSARLLGPLQGLIDDS